MNFDYEKAYCVLALPAFKAFNPEQVKAFNTLLPMVKDLGQKIDLNIPVYEGMVEALNPLSCQELAEMARASYFVGHWYPSLLPRPFDNTSGESWKIANVIDQVLSTRLSPLPYNTQIHDGKLRVTYSDPYNWLWQEFGLATEENLNRFKTCKLSFDLYNIEKSADKLKVDLWDYDNTPENDIYQEYKILRVAKRMEELKKRQADKLKSIEKDIENSKKELSAFTWLIENGLDHDNVIYYNHTDTFCFGWRDKLSETEKIKLTEALKGFPYKWEFKKGA